MSKPVNPEALRKTGSVRFRTPNTQTSRATTYKITLDNGWVTRLILTRYGFEEVDSFYAPELSVGDLYPIARSFRETNSAWFAEAVDWQRYKPVSAYLEKGSS